MLYLPCFGVTAAGDIFEKESAIMFYLVESVSN